MLYEPPKTKKYILIGAVVLVLAVLAIVIFQKMKPKPAEAPPAAVQKTTEEKQQDMQDAINKANESAVQNQLLPETQIQKQQDMMGTIDKANAETLLVSADEAKKRQQDMLRAINVANKK